VCKAPYDLARRRTAAVRAWPVAGGSRCSASGSFEYRRDLTVGKGTAPAAEARTGSAPEKNLNQGVKGRYAIRVGETPSVGGERFLPFGLAGPPAPAQRATRGSDGGRQILRHEIVAMGAEADRPAVDVLEAGLPCKLMGALSVREIAAGAGARFHPHAAQ
jgi:hypothetical protein